MTRLPWLVSQQMELGLESFEKIVKTFDIFFYTKTILSSKKFQVLEAEEYAL